MSLISINVHIYMLQYTQPPLTRVITGFVGKKIRIFCEYFLKYRLFEVIFMSNSNFMF